MRGLESLGDQMLARQTHGLLKILFDPDTPRIASMVTRLSLELTGKVQPENVPPHILSLGKAAVSFSPPTTLRVHAITGSRGVERTIFLATVEAVTFDDKNIYPAPQEKNSVNPLTQLTQAQKSEIQLDAIHVVMSDMWRRI